MGDLYAGIYRDASADTWMFFNDSSTKPDAAATFNTGASGTIGKGIWAATTVAVAYGGTGVTSKTGTGANVQATSPTLVTPLLGTPTSGDLSNCSGLAGISGTLGTANGGTGQTSTTYASLTANVSGVLPVANGGTALTSLSTLLNSNVTASSLSLVIGTNTQAWSAILDTVTAGTYAGDDSIVTVGTVTAGTIAGGTF